LPWFVVVEPGFGEFSQREREREREYRTAAVLVIRG
jgi:hypothetical protein